ncbi:MAG: hypothetical protein ACOYLB_07920 [Phototrophicaceae bacterium]
MSNDSNTQFSFHVTGNINAGNNVSISGRDVNMNIQAGGDFHQSGHIYVGGVEATPEQLQTLQKKLGNLEKTIQNEPLSAEVLQGALATLGEFKAQLTASHKPDGNKIVDLAKKLGRLSPTIAGTLISIFADPLVGQIVSVAGEAAFSFYERLRASRPEYFNR